LHVASAESTDQPLAEAWESLYIFNIHAA
jgi:hypothetical protein